MKPAFLAFALAAATLGGCTKARPAPPDWVSTKFALLKRLGIDPTADLVEAATYHWSWVSRGEVVAGPFRCPAGSSVDVSRTIVVARAPDQQVCKGADGVTAPMLKVLPDGSAEPLGA